MSSLMDFSHPDRKSDARFQEILDTFVGDKQTVLTGNLPELLSAYERDHDVRILDEEDLDGVQNLCQQYPDYELGPTELFQFLMAVLQPPTPTGYPTPDSSRQHPAEGNSEHSTPQNHERRRRRHSDRIRSPSDSSSSSSGEEDGIKQYRQGSAPPTTMAFPETSNTSPNPTGFAVPVRKKTMSDPNRSDNSIEYSAPARILRRGANPPSAFAGGFARPSPVNRRRRGSSSAPVDEDMKSPDLYNGPMRSFSGSSERGASPQSWIGRPSSRQSRPPTRPTTPMSPVDQIDNTSFHERAKSPETDDGMDEEEQIERRVVPEMELDDVEDEGDEGRDGLNDVSGNDSMMPRLSRISTESTASLHTSHDQLRRLRKENNELSRKLKETEKSLAVQGAENERMVEDLQIRLEEAQSEIAQRRKDEKEMRGKDRAQSIQISGFESDIAGLQRSLENARANHASMQKMFNSQCEEAGRLRDMLRDRDLEIRELEEIANAHAADEQKLTQEIQALESEVKRLEGDLSLARQAESHLQIQKQENLALKETIDRMRFDLDEARAAAALVGGGAGRGGVSAATSSAGGTLSRNLGDELGRRLVEVVKEESNEKEDEEGSFVETIVTTQRTRKRGGKSPQPQAGTSSSPPMIQVDEGVREYIDVSTETDSTLLRIPASPPAYTAEPPPGNAEDVLKKAHPRDHNHRISEEGPSIEGEEEYDVLVDALGVRCTLLEETMKMKRMDKAKHGGPPVRRRKRAWVEDHSAGLVQYIFYGTNDARENAGRFAVFAVAAFAFGVIAGSHLLGPSAAGLHPRDYKLFQQMNTLAGVAGIGEGFLPAHMLGVVENGARLVAGRIPS